MRIALRTAIYIFLPFVTFLNAQQFASPNTTDFGRYVTVGTCWGDFNNDGYIDVYMSNGEQGFQWENFLYKNNGDGTFDSLASAGTVTSHSYTHAGASWGDYNNDGWLDMVNANAFTRNVGGFSGNRSETKLYVNDQDETFTEVTSLGSFGAEATVSKIAAVWADFDNDGFLDVLESNSTFLGTGSAFTAFTNDATGTNPTFSSESNNITSQGTSARAGLVWCDFDEDGDMDVVTLSGAVAQHTILWTNNGTNFDSTRILVGGGSTGPNSQSATWLDYDNDGDLDIYIGLGANDDSSPQANRLFRNDNGTLVEIVSGVGPIITDTDLTLVTVAFDYDNDGDVDIFMGTDGGTGTVPPYNNRLYENNGSGVFTENTSTPLDDEGFARSGAVADYDNDGDLDFMLGREGPNWFYKNNEMENDGTRGWAGVLCQGNGTTINTTAIGSLVKLNASLNSSNYTQIRDVSAQTGRGSHHSFRQHFGLSDATKIDQLDVFWSTVNTTTSYTDLPINKNYVYAYGDLTATASTKTIDGFVYLFGNTGAGVELESHGDATVETITATRTNSDPGGTFSGSATAPDASTVSPNIVASERYWTITTSLTTFTAEVYLDITGIAGISNPDKLVIMSRPNSGSAWTPHNTLRIGNTLYTNANLTSFSEFGIGANSSDNSLPVELTAFAANAGDGMVELNWATSSELENVGFIIERAMGENGVYEEIASYKTDDALKGQGNSSVAKEYAYTDYSAMNGQVYHYRLSDVSTNGLRTYHGTVEARPVQLISSFALHQNYPNPFNPSTTIEVDVPSSETRVKATISVYNAAGQKVADLFAGELQSGNHRFSWNGKNTYGKELGSGIYFIRLAAGSFSASRKMVLIR